MDSRKPVQALGINPGSTASGSTDCPTTQLLPILRESNIFSAKIELVLEHRTGHYQWKWNCPGSTPSPVISPPTALCLLVFVGACNSSCLSYSTYAVCNCVCFFLKEYIQLCKKYYSTEPEAVDFLKYAEEARKKINSWVKTQTKGKTLDFFFFFFSFEIKHPWISPSFPQNCTVNSLLPPSELSKSQTTEKLENNIQESDSSKYHKKLFFICSIIQFLSCFIIKPKHVLCSL